MWRLGSFSLVSMSCFILCGCEERLSDAAKRLPAAEAKALKLATEYWTKERAPCVLDDNCRVEVKDGDHHMCRSEPGDDGEKWRVSLSQGEGINGSSFVTCIDKVTGAISDAYWLVS